MKGQDRIIRRSVDATEAELVRAKKKMEVCPIRAEVTEHIGRLLVTPGNYISPALPT